jgi:hypothetical protein
MTICRSCGGNNAASSETSVVSEDPSGVRVKLKKGTLDIPLISRLFRGGDTFVTIFRRLRALHGGTIGERGEIAPMRCLDGCVRTGVAAVASFDRSLYEREAEVTSDDEELFREGE